MMQNVFTDDYEAKKLLSELHSLRKLSSVKQSVFTTKVFDIIIPRDIDLATDDPVEYIFIVMEFVDHDLN